MVLSALVPGVASWWCYPHSSRRCRLAVPPALALTQQPPFFQAVLPACLLKQCCSGGATCTRLAVPPARASHFHATPAVLPAHVPDDASHASNVASLASVFSPVSALLPAGALTVSHTRREAVRRASSCSIVAASFIARRFPALLLRCYPPTSLV